MKQADAMKIEYYHAMVERLCPSVQSTFPYQAHAAKSARIWEERRNENARAEGKLSYWEDHWQQWSCPWCGCQKQYTSIRGRLECDACGHPVEVS
jgi:rubredoxin